MVITQLGIVATGNALASEAGAAVLSRGGSAMDAAIAANAAMSVVEYMNNGIGGDLFAIYYQANSGEIYGLNARMVAEVAHARIPEGQRPLQDAAPRH